MTRLPLIWPAGLTASAIVHVGAAAALVWAVKPDPVTEQTKPETQMEVQAYQVERTRATEATPVGEDAASGETKGASLDPGAIPQSHAKPTAVPTEKLDNTQAGAPKLAALNDAVPVTHALPVSAQTATPLAGAPVRLAANTTRPAPKIAAALPDLQSAPEAVPFVQPVAQSATPAARTGPTEPDVTSAKATLAFTGANDGPVDPVSLAAFQSFMQPGDPGSNAAELRDGIAGLLNQVPCSRMQVRFQPDSNTLEVTGHVPEDGLREPVLAALQARMGTNIAVSDNLLILPRPQCGALAGIANVGLAQSTDQITNPLLVGEDTHARVFSYVQDQPLVLDMQGADYDAYLYVDFFDAGGNVLHLAPNEFTPLVLTQAKSAVRIGSEHELTPGEPGLFIKIGPPYGQEIAVAFAASAPLYSGNRPLVEPADAYLVWLKEQIARARARDSKFKGEWVYFFVSTAAE
jgi:hypothetical protein